MAAYESTEPQYFETQDQFEERVIEIARVAIVVKGGRRFQFRVTVVVGDKRGTISMGVGKANAVPDAMRKASERARKNMRVVNLAGTTIPHEVLGKVAGAKVMAPIPAHGSKAAVQDGAPPASRQPRPELFIKCNGNGQASDAKIIIE